jgi:heme A synthase
MNETTRNDRIRLGRLAAAAAVATYALIVFGGIVRITGSGMGCGDDWPLCNGRLIPPMDFETMIEYGHRLAALGVSVLVAAFAVLAWRPGRRATSTLRRLSLVALLLLVVQILLGAVTVWLELPPSTVVMHFGTALALLTVLTVGACTGLSGSRRQDAESDQASRAVRITLAFAFGVALLGALVANMEAGPACLGFPACNGSWLPGGSGLVHVHWTHRLAAYLLFLALLVLPVFIRRRRPGDAQAFNWSLVALGAGVAQIGVGAAMVLALFPAGLRTAHLALGAALVAALIVCGWFVRRPRTGPEPELQRS